MAYTPRAPGSLCQDFTLLQFPVVSERVPTRGLIIGVAGGNPFWSRGLDSVGKLWMYDP